MLTDLLSYMNFTFTMCFTFEAILKLIAFGPGVSRDGGYILLAMTQQFFHSIFLAFLWSAEIIKELPSIIIGSHD